MKFRPELAKLILKGEKTSTWRLFDDKQLSTGDELSLVNWETDKEFGRASINGVYEKKMSQLTDTDFKGHERFSSDEEMYCTYRTYYGDTVGPETIVKIIQFEVLPETVNK